MRRGPFPLTVLPALLVFPSVGMATPLPLDARRIQDAIDGAKPGDVIELAAGPIEGELRVDKPLVVRGAGRDRTVFLSRGHRPALVVGVPEGGEVVLEGLTFTTQPGGPGHAGAGVMLYGPGTIVLRDLALRRTITGRCLTAAVTFADRPRIRMERVEIENHRCFVAGAFVVEPGAEVLSVDSLLSANVGELAGAILVTGGRLRLERSVLRGNRFARGDDGHHLTVGAGPARIELVASEIATDADRSIAFELMGKPEVAMERMDWPEGSAPSFVRSLAP